MSNVVELQFIYTPQPHIISNQFPKQQPASKLVNRYLSTAAQYLNRTKSFHVPTTHNNNNNSFIPTSNKDDQHISYKHFLTHNVNLAQSIPTNMHSISPSTNVNASSNGEQRFEVNSSDLPLNGNKPQGIVNTLRRSLRKNKERFYNKRSTTMKSCHSLNTYEQTMNEHQNIHAQISMTPTLLCRRQHLAKNMTDKQMCKKNRQMFYLLKPILIILILISVKKNRNLVKC
jgi:hypothetical protein